jgi:hypothetical protein
MGGRQAWYGQADGLLSGGRSQEKLKSLLDAGSKTIRETKDVGGGRQIVSVKDENSNIIGWMQDF